MLKKILAVLAMLLFSAMAMAAVDVNKATEAELDSVKGIGPGTTKLIVTERKKGDFKDWNDFITRVKGVGDKRAEHLSDAGLTVGGKAFKPAMADKAATAKKDDKAAVAKTNDKPASAAKANAKPASAAKADEKKIDMKKAEAKADAKEAKAEAKAKEAKAEAKAAPASAKK